jgi:hypothetical protein
VSQEVIPQWAVNFFDPFSVAASEPNNGAQAAAAQNEHRGVAASLASQQAPLGVWNGPAELQTKTARNSGAPAMHHQVVGNVDAENVYEGVEDVDGEFVEGRDDVAQHHVAPCQCITNGSHHQNVYLHDFSPDGNDPSSRYSEVRGAYSSIATIVCSVA